MGFIKKNLNNILIGVVVLAALYYGYVFFFMGSGEEETPLPEEEQAQVGEDLLLLLADLKTISLDESIFEDTSFKNLKNFRVELSPEPVGRDNPFAPVSGIRSSQPGIQITGFGTQ